MSPVHFVAFLLAVGHVSAHMCLLSPRQRGPLDISHAGSSTCTRHELPCGGQDVEMPSVTYTAGDKVFFKWQQNFNHYEPGYPGYMDIAIADSVSSTNFTTLAVVTDKYVHAQHYQENITALITIPNMPCDHCVIRARYNAHKPGETPFLQCADIRIAARSTQSSRSALKFIPGHTSNEKRKMMPFKRALRHSEKMKNRHGSQMKSTNLYGFAYNPFQPGRSHYVAVNTEIGEVEPVFSYFFGIDSPQNKFSVEPAKTFMVDEVVSVDNTRNTSNILLHVTGSRDDISTRLYIIGNSNGTLVQESNLFEFKGGAINALSWYTTGLSAVFRIQPAENNEGWFFEVGTLDFGGLYDKRASTPKPEPLYVNFQWFETDVNNYQIVYALLGNENAPDALNARIYTYNLYDGKFLQSVELDVTSYTFMSIHSYPNSRELYAFSPGLWEDETHAWTLVAVNPKTGKVTKHCDIAPPGIFQRFYGGSVNQGNANLNGILYHVLRVEGSEADFIVGVDPRTCAVTFSEPTNLRHLHSLQRIDPNFP